MVFLPLRSVGCQELYAEGGFGVVVIITHSTRLRRNVGRSYYVLIQLKCGTLRAKRYIFKGIDHGPILIRHYGFLFRFCVD